MRRSTAAPPEAERRIRLCAHTPADLLSLIPFQLGFHPAESVVTVFLRSGQVKLTARVDLPPPDAAADFARHLRGLARQHSIDELVLFAYSAHPEPAQALLTGVMRSLPTRLVREGLYVDGSRWWSLTCDRSCCPVEGTPYDLTSHPLAAAAVYAGMTARASREELAATVSGPREEDIGDLVDLTAAVRQELDESADLWRTAERLQRDLRAAVSDPAGLDDRSCAVLALLVTNLRLRDVGWAMIDFEDAEQHVEVWLRVVNRVPPELSAGPLGLLGVAGWIAGHGALLNCCADRLRDQHPGYSMGRLLADISEWAVSPSLWRTIRPELRAEPQADIDPAPLR